MTSEMAFECLLVSRDVQIFSIMTELLNSLSISTNLCLSPSKAVDLFSDQTTDLLVIDWEDASTCSKIMHRVWNSGKRQKATIVGISDQNDAVRGAHVALFKPLTPEAGAKSLKVAYSRMLQEHRRHTRYPLMKVTVSTDQNDRQIPVRVTDIGYRGIGLTTKQELAVEDVLRLQIELPGAVKAIAVEARVLWTREYGAAGCEFLRILPVDTDILHDWLEHKTQIKKPLIKLWGDDVVVEEN